MAYEIWRKSKWGQRQTIPEETVSTIDFAMIKAEELSKKEFKNISFGWGNPWGSGVFEKEIIFVLDCSSVPKRVRGFGIGGKWNDAKECKRCDNNGIDSKDISIPCSSCKGASWKPNKI